MPGPLAGLTVLDLTRILSGPFCTMLLADFGADVIKIEQPEVGDPARGNGPFLTTDADGNQVAATGQGPGAFSSYFMSINRNKRSVAIDLTKPKGAALLLDLVGRADVLVENFRPGTMEKFGLGYETLQACNPRLVMASISGFGQSGPYASRPALDVIVQGMGGMLSITGEPGRGPVRPGASIGDITAALFTTVAIQGALLEREKSNKGQYIDISMLDCQVAIMENAFTRYFTLGEIPERIGTRRPSSTPFQAFKTADGHLVVAIMGGSTEMWPLFCAGIEHPELIDDERYQSGWGRTQNYDELIPIIEEALLQQTNEYWVELLSGMGIPVGPVQNIAEVAQDPQVNERGMFVEIDHPTLGPVRFAGNPIKLSRTPTVTSSSPPDLGEHSVEVLVQQLGLTNTQVAELVADGIVS